MRITPVAAFVFALAALFGGLSATHHAPQTAQHRAAVTADAPAPVVASTSAAPGNNGNG
jgi:hypothetical protein